MVNVLSLRFQQCLGPFMMLLVKGFSEKGLFKQLSNYVFWSPYYGKYITCECHPFFEIFQNYQKEIKKNFFVSHNYPTTFLGVSNFGST